jgi:hypothetical protein
MIEKVEERTEEDTEDQDMQNHFTPPALDESDHHPLPEKHIPKKLPSHQPP